MIGGERYGYGPVTIESGGSGGGDVSNKDYELIKPSCEGWENPLVRQAYVKGQWDLRGFHEHRRTSFDALMQALDCVHVEENGYQQVINYVTQYGLQKARIFFIGNGGSAAVASHMATDWQKNGGFATFGPPDSSLMSCYGNDYGFKEIYSEVIGRHGQLGDVLFAISSSGMSENILHAVDLAKAKRMNVITLSGFGQGNFLRTKGQVNFYVPSNQYGTVEIAHLAIIHSILDEVIASVK